MKLNQQEAELDKIRYNMRSPKQDDRKSLAFEQGPLKAESSHVPLRLEEKEELRRSIENLHTEARQTSGYEIDAQPEYVFNNSRSTSDKKQPRLPSAELYRRNSPASTLDLDALDRLNEARLKRLGLKSDGGSSSKHKGDWDIDASLITDFIKDRDENNGGLLVDTTIQ